MKLTFIGVESGMPWEGRPSSCILLQNEENWIFDLGSGSLCALQKVMDIGDVDGVILTHFHPDHDSDLLIFAQSQMLLSILGMQAKKPLILMPENPEIWEKMEKFGDYINLQKLMDSVSLKRETFELKFHKNHHEPTCYATALLRAAKKEFVYTSDTGYTDSLAEFAEGSDLLISECSLYEQGDFDTHMSPEYVIRLIQNSGAKKTVITHLPVYGNRSELLTPFAKAGVEVTMAEAGMVLRSI